MGYLDNTGLAYLWQKVKTLLNAKAPTSHASTATTYGMGTASNYGHVKLSDSTASTSAASAGIAASPNAVKAAYDLASAAQSGINNLQIGGRNLLFGTAKMSNATADSSGYTDMGTIEYQSDGSALVINDSTNVRFRIKTASGSTLLDVSAGEVFTVLACYKEVSGTQAYQFQISYGNPGLSAHIKVDGAKINLGDGWVKSYYTFTVPNGYTKLMVWFRSGLDGVAYIHSYYIKHPKLERGSKPTDWTPAPEDVDASIAAAQSTADAAMPKTGGTFQGDISGATVSAGSWSFKNISVHTSAGGDTGTNVQRIVMLRK